MSNFSDQSDDGPTSDEPTDRAGGRATADGLGGTAMDPLDRDLLISRVVDGVASTTDWSSMDVIARTDPAIWRDLAQAQRCNADLTQAVRMAIVGAERVVITGHSLQLDAPASFDIQAHAQSRFNAMARWTGWAAAAVLALAWVSGVRTGNPVGARPGPADRPSQAAGVNPLDPLLSGTASDLLAEYLRKGQESGRVVAEVPSKMMLEAIPMDDQAGGYEVYFVRQIVERTRVPNLYTFAEGEGGQLQAVKARISAPRRSGSY